MGIYLNPGNTEFKNAAEKMIYVDKSLLIEKVSSYAKDINRYLCISRPRRFGKSTDANRRCPPMACWLPIIPRAVIPMRYSTD